MSSEALSSLLPLLIIGLVIYAIIVWRQRAGGPEASDPSIGAIRRVYLYGASFVTLMMAANGIMIVLQFVLAATFETDVVSRSSVPLAIGGSLTVVGLPLWGLHWLFIRRYVRDIPVERRSLLRKLYVYVVLGVALGIFIAAANGLLQWAFGAKSFSGFHWAGVIVWAAVWAFHWRMESAEGQSTPETLAVRRLYLYFVALATLVMASIGLGRVVHVILVEGYEALVSLPVLLPTESGLWRPAMREALALALVAVPVWAYHWLHAARGDFGSTLRWVYLYGFAVLGGAVTVMVATGIIINGTLTWLLGISTEETAGSHFRFLPGATVTLSVGVGLWGYHWMVARSEAEGSALEAQAARKGLRLYHVGAGPRRVGGSGVHWRARGPHRFHRKLSKPPGGRRPVARALRPVHHTGRSGRAALGLLLDVGSASGERRGRRARHRAAAAAHYFRRARDRGACPPRNGERHHIRIPSGTSWPATCRGTPCGTPRWP